MSRYYLPNHGFAIGRRMPQSLVFEGFEFEKSPLQVFQRPIWTGTPKRRSGGRDEGIAPAVCRNVQSPTWTRDAPRVSRELMASEVCRATRKSLPVKSGG